MVDAITIRRPDDFHLHLRQGDQLTNVFGYTAEVFARGIPMPNIMTEDDPLDEGMRSPPVWTASMMEQYRRSIEQVRYQQSHDAARKFESLMSIALLDQTQPRHIVEAVEAGAIIAKAYPVRKKLVRLPSPSILAGPVGEMTTNAHYGISDFRAPALQPTLQAMSDTELTLSIHGEKPSSCSLDREKDFLTDLVWLHEHYPQLKIVLEHITTAAAIGCVNSLGANVAATVTVHHLILTIDDVIGGKLNPHNFCKPIAKYPQDQEALLGAVVSGLEKIFLGTDSAPHLKENKECAQGCAGVFSAPVAMQVLTQLFEECGVLPRLEPFVSEFGARFYGLPLNNDTITMIKRPWVVPSVLAGGIVPYMAGGNLDWQVEGVEVLR